MRLVLPSSDEFCAVRKTARRLISSGFPTRLVGGCVRDLLLSRAPSDFDLVTTAPWQKVAAIFPDARLVGQSFGVVLVRADGFEFEVATAREERNYLDGRHPESIKTTCDFSVDARRRDFTFNALSCDPETGEIFDTTGGIADLEKGVVRTVGEAERRFTEDYLRMLRAVRFAARYRFEIAPETFDAIARNAHLAAQIAPERVRVEVTEMLTCPDPARAVFLLEKTGLLEVILPEVARLRRVEQPPAFHPEGDVLEHTLLMLSHMALPSALLAWSVLLHDVGKKDTAFRDETGRIRFFGHERRGAEIAKEILTRLHFSREEIRTVCKAVENHMRFAAVEQMKESRLRTFVARENFALELELNRLDCFASHHLMGAFVRLLDFLHTLPDVKLPPPLVNGDDLIALGLVPSPRFKTLLDALFDEQISRKIPDRTAMLEIAKKYAEDSRG